MAKHSDLMLPYLEQVLISLQLPVTQQQLDDIANFDDFLIEYNEKINLTRITDPKEVAVKHFGDSLTLLCYSTIPAGARLIDVGAGAGFPGIPLAIMRPDLHITLVDSLRKRTTFLTELAQRLSLTNVEIDWGRIEELGQNPKFREKFDGVIARAVAPLNVLAELCLPLTKLGGFFLSLKGPKAETEIVEAAQAIKLLGGQLVSNKNVVLPLLDDCRSLVFISKVALTPRSYPRKAGIPERQPL